MNLYEAFLETLKNDKAKITSDFLKKDLKVFLKNSKQSLASLIKLPYVIIQKVKNDGVKTIFDDSKESLKELHHGLKKVPPNFKRASSDFYKTLQSEIESKDNPKEKTDYILRVLTYFTFFLIGVWAGYKWPDKDISLLGIGKHRNAFTHSALLLLFIKIFSLFLLRLINEVEGKLDYEDENRNTLQFLKNNLIAITSGAAVGVSAHLFEDAIFEPTGTIRGPGFRTFVHGTLVDDQAFLLINSFFAALFGKELEKKASDILNQSETTPI